METGTTEVDTGAGWSEERDILRQRVAELEAQLHQSRVHMGRQLRFTEALLAAIPTPVFFKDAQGRYMGCNDAFAEQMGVNTEEIKGKTVHELWPSAHAETYHRKDLELMQRPHHQVYESVVRDNAGQDRDVIFAKNVFFDETGQVAGLVGAYLDITERKRMEEALRKGQELLNAIQRLAHIGGWEWDVMQQTMTWTDETYRIHGLQPGAVAAGSAEHIQRSLTCYDPEDRPVIEAAFQRCAAQGQPYDLEFPLATVDGRRVWIRTMAEPVWEGDRVVKVLGNIIDITERKRAEDALRESEQRFRELADLLPQVVSEIDTDGNLTYANRMAFDMFGYTPQDLEQGLNVFQMLAPEERERAARAIQATVAGTMPERDREYRALRKDGSTFPALIYVSPIVHQERVTGLRGLVVDITERKRAEKQLQESEERFRTLADNIPGVVYLCRNDERYSMIYLNQAVEQLTGYPRAEFLQDRITFVELYHPDDAPGIIPTVNAALEKRQSFHLIYRLRRSDGAWRWVEE